MNLLQEYWESNVMHQFNMLLDGDGDGDEFTVDDSGFTVVDGEEGDYGTILYSDSEGLVATKIVHGGDREEVIFTRYGKWIMVAKLAAMFRKANDAALGLTMV